MSALNKFSPEFKEWFESHLQPDGECILWMGSRYAHGYGKVVYGQRAICGMAHRISFELYNAEIPAGLLALHICDNRPCVNPNHIVLGTNKANMYDMKRKHRAAAGERHHASRLTMEQAHRIREAAQNFDYATHGHIAKQFGVSRSTVTKIISGKAYKTGG